MVFSGMEDKGDPAAAASGRLPPHREGGPACDLASTERVEREADTCWRPGPGLDETVPNLLPGYHQLKLAFCHLGVRVLPADPSPEVSVGRGLICHLCPSVWHSALPVTATYSVPAGFTEEQMSED